MIVEKNITGNLTEFSRAEFRNAADTMVDFDESRKAVRKSFTPENANVHVQYGGKSYTGKDLAKIARNVWVYDMGRKQTEIKNMEIYVKPEENTAYFVVNRNETGKFFI